MRVSCVLLLLVGCTLYDRGLVPEDGGTRDARGVDAPGEDVGGEDAPPLDVPFVDGGEAGAICPDGFADCNGDRNCDVNINRDPANCGGCAISCGMASLCDRGACVCMSDRADCDGEPGCETNVTTATNCGGCGIVCGANAGCMGSCVCESGWGDCNGDLGTSGGDGCETRLNVDAACGACDAACLPGQMCQELGDPPAPTCDGCGLIRPPNIMFGTSGVDTTPLVFALRDPIIDQDFPLWQDVAFDVDGHCTDDASEGICLSGMGVISIDGPGGIDNVLGRDVLPGADAITGECPADPTETCTFSERVSQLMEQGTNAAMVIISEWDGSADDDRVRVDILQPAGFDREDGNPLPQWDGFDRFYPSTASFDLAGFPFVSDPAAYVTGNTLVMRIPDGRGVDIPWPGGNPFSISLSNALMVADIQLSPVARLRNVRLGGRYPISTLTGNLDEAGVCEPPLVIGTVRQQAINLADVMTSTTFDIPSESPTRSCDAISAWLGFTGYPVIRGSMNMDPPPLLTPEDC